MLTKNHSFGSLSSVGPNPLHSAPNEALPWLNNNREAGIDYIHYSRIQTPASMWNFHSSYRILVWRRYEMIHLCINMQIIVIIF